MAHLPSKLRKFTTLTTILLLIHFTSSRTPYSLFESFILGMKKGVRFQDAAIPDARYVLPEYDFIVVGGGSAGCVLANRLSENPDHSVLVIEAGRDENIVMDIPLLANYFQLTETNWGHQTLPQESACLGMKNKQCKLPRGKVLGGSSVINYMVFTRGNKKDYDGWRDLGNTGWGYDDVLPYFKRLEDTQIPDVSPELRGYGGPITVTYPPYRTELANTFLNAGKEFGYNIIDYNGDNQTGFSYLQTTMKNGTRLSSNRAYIMPIKNRKNLHVKKLSVVTKILINSYTKQAYGVEFLNNGKKFKIRARKEVILSAGVFGTPQILILSGIGPKDHLKSLGIPVIKNLKVGYNLQDHIALGGLTFVINKKLSLKNERIIDNINYLVDFLVFHQGPVSVPGGVEALAFVNTKLNNDSSDYPDIELMFISGSYASDPTLQVSTGLNSEIYNSVLKPIENKDTFSIFPMIMRPKSKGKVLLQSRNPLKLPLIKHNYLTEGKDLDVILEGTKIAINIITKSKSFKKFGTKLHTIPIPACKQYKFNSDDYWRCAIRQLTTTIYHQCGTAKMGPPYDPEAVVDPELRVYGIKGLRVVDASIMPFVPTAHLIAPVYMIAEKGADLIKNTWKSKKKKTN